MCYIMTEIRHEQQNINKAIAAKAMGLSLKGMAVSAGDIWMEQGLWRQLSI